MNILDKLKKRHGTLFYRDLSLTVVVNLLDIIIIPSVIPRELSQLPYQSLLVRSNGRRRYWGLSCSQFTAGS